MFLTHELKYIHYFLSILLHVHGSTSYRWLIRMEQMNFELRRVKIHIIDMQIGPSNKSF